jgi:hypothetical protein
MNTLTCVEKVNPKRVEELINSPVVANEKKAVLRKLKKNLSKDGSYKVRYTQKDGIGRFYPDECPSIQNLDRNIRKYLTCEDHTDVDMVNAHPVIFSQTFKKHEYDCHYLDKYIANREDMLKDMVNIVDKTLSTLNSENSKYKTVKDEYKSTTDEDKRELAKTQFLRILYGGSSKSLSFDVWDSQKKKDERKYIPWDAPDYLKGLEAEFKSNGDKLLKLEQYKHYLELAEKDFNPLGTGLSYLAQDIERKIILTVRDVFESKGYKPSTIIHDGFLVECLPEDLHDDVLRRAEHAVRATHEYDIRLEKKCLTDFDSEKILGKDSTNDDEESHTEYAIAFLIEMTTLGHVFVCDEDSTYWYKPEIGIYEVMDSRTWGQLRSFLNKSEVLPAKKRGFTVFQNNIKTQLEGLIPYEERWADLIIDTVHRKIPFKNGVYCLTQKKLIPYESSMYFLEKGTVEYKDDVDEKLKDEVYRRVFLEVFHEEEVAKYVLKLLARAIAGEWSDRVFVIVRGKPSSGKGSMGELLRRVFSSLVGGYDAGVLCGKSCKGDVNKENSWKIDHRNKRFMQAHERPTQRVSAEKVKQVSSGGDTQAARANFGRKNINFKMVAMFWLFINLMVQITGLDESAKTKIKVISTYNEYLLPDKYNDRKKKFGFENDKDFEKRFPSIKRADPTLKTEFLTRTDVHQAFAKLLIEYYDTEVPDTPATVMTETDEYLQDDNEDDKIETLFQFTGKEDDKLHLSDLQKKAKDNFMCSNTKILRDKITEITGKKWKRTTYKGVPNVYFITGAVLIEEERENFFIPANFGTADH